MAVFKLLVLTNPAAGREDEYNEWYSNQHIHDIVNLPNGISGQRYLVNVDSQWKYAAIYELEGETAADAVAAMRKHTGTPALPMSDTLDLSNALMLPLTPITGLVTRETARKR